MASPALSRTLRALALVTAGASALQAVPAAAQCVPELPADDVVVRIRTSPPTGAIERREHARITPALAQALCIEAADVRADGNRSPQVRVEITADPTGQAALASTALFTVTAINGTPTAENDRIVEVWDRRTTTETENGLRKLFPTASSASTINDANPPAAARLYRIAPASTTEVRYSLAGRLDPVETVHYADPNADEEHLFEEFFQFGEVHHVAVLIPHGGDIEPGISESIWRVNLGLDMYTSDVPDIWEGYGDWGNGGETSRRWHITAPDLSAESFPGLERLLDQAAAESYDYAVAVHGFSEADKALVIGGQADLEEKCYLAVAVQSRLHELRNQVAITIFYLEGSTIRSLNVPDEDGRTYGNRTDLRAFDNDNVVNRMSPNPGHLPGHGGFQFEASKGLRDSEAMEGVMSGIGTGLGQLWSYPPAAEDYCDLLVYPD